MSDSWPKHPDGRNKKMGEMTKDEQDRELALILDSLKRELESPAVADAVDENFKVLKGRDDRSGSDR